jgi:hypothetical protein
MSAEPVSSPASGGGPTQPAAIRSQLSPELVTIFDREWELVLEDAKRTQDRQAIHDHLQHWRHFAAAEAKEPGWYFRVMETAERILAGGSTEAAGIKTYDARAVIEARLGNSQPPVVSHGLYRVNVSEEARDAIEALPAVAVTGLAEAINVLETAPWRGQP